MPITFKSSSGKSLDKILPIDAFGSVTTAEETPIIQIYGKNGIRDDVLTVFDGVGAAVDTENSQYRADTGTSPFGVSSILTRDRGTYKPGQGLVARFTALFDTPQPNSIQVAGFIHAEDIYAFGYYNESFGIIRAVYGSTEIQKLTITAPVVGSGNASITINGVLYSVPLTDGTAEHGASEIERFFYVTPIPNWTVTANGNVVTALSGAPVPAGSFAFSSANVTGIWSQERVGALPNYEHIQITDWDNTPTWDIDPSKGNVYKIVLPYLGYDGPRFYIKNPRTGEFDLVHYYRYLNSNIIPHTSNPTFRVGWAAQNLGNTTNLTIRGASAGIFCQGKYTIDDKVKGANFTQPDVTTTETNVISIRNRSVFNGAINTVDIFPNKLFLANSATREAFFYVRINPTFSGGDLTWEYSSEANSVAEIATDKISVTNGTGSPAILVGAASPSGQIDLSAIVKKLSPRDILTISAKVVKVGTGDMSASITWQEDQ